MDFTPTDTTNYTTASKTVSLTVNKAGQTITFTSLAPATAHYGDTYIPTATGGGSGNAVIFGASGACSYNTSTGVVSMTAVGTCTVTADQAGNTNYEAATQATQIFTVPRLEIRGFYAPVDMNGVVNAVKAGSIVPLKFEIFAGSTELTDTSNVRFVVTKVNCTSGAIEDTIEITTTGGTSLRYDNTSGQYIQNWKTPTGVGACYKVSVYTVAADGSKTSNELIAYFRMK